MNLGWTEILLIGGIALLMFGPSRLPGLGKSMGEAIRGFKKGLNEDAAPEYREVTDKIAQNNEKPLNSEIEKAAQKDSHKES